MEKKIILILLAGYVLDNSYRFIQELFLLATDRVNTFAFIPELLIPEVVKYLVECFFMYAWLMNAMRTGTLAFKNTASLLLFSGLLFLVRATVGTFIFIFLYALLFEFIPPLPVLLGYPLPQDLWSIYFKPLQYAGLTIFSTWICVKLSCLVFRRTQRLKLSEAKKEDLEEPRWQHGMIWYSFSAAIIAVTVFYCLSVGRTPLLTFSRLSGGLGSQLAENVFIWAFLGFPAVGALLVFSFGRTATSSLRRLIYAGGLAGLVCSLLVYSGTRLLIALDMGFPNIGVTIFSLAFTYLLCFMGFSWCVRKLFETRYQQKQK